MKYEKVPGLGNFQEPILSWYIVPPTIAALIRVTSEEKQEDEHCRGLF